MRNQQLIVTSDGRKLSRAERLEARNSLLLSIIRKALDEIGADSFDAACETLSNASHLQLSSALKRDEDARAMRRTASIIITRVEGDPCHVVITRDTAGDDDLWFAADCLIRGWAQAMSPKEQETYHKTDYMVVWADGSIWKDNFDIYHITSPHFLTLTEHVFPYIETYPVLQEHETGSPLIGGVYVARCIQKEDARTFFYTSSLTKTYEWYQGRRLRDWRYHEVEEPANDSLPFVGPLPAEIRSELPKLFPEIALMDRVRHAA